MKKIGSLVLTPKLQMAIKLLGMSWRQLYTLIEEEMARCPHLRWEPPEVDPAADVEIAVHSDKILAWVSDTGELYVATNPSGDRDGGSTDVDAYREAQWLVRSVEQRHKSIERVVEALAARQEPFLRGHRGTPETISLRSLADEVAFHESTVRRVLSGKTVRVEDREMALDHLMG